MSIKTLRKRIALVAVSSLGVGLLSVVPANAFGAADATLYIGTTASNTGAASASQTLSSTTSVGFVTLTSTPSGAPTGGYSVTTGTAVTGVVLAGAQIPFQATGAATSATGVSVVVTGGTLSSISADAPLSATAASTETVNGSATVAVSAQTGTSVTTMIGVVTVNAAVGSTVTIASYTGTGITGTTSATNGSLSGIFTFTVASASASGTYSATQSDIWTQPAVAKGTTSGSTNAYDSTAKIDNGKVGVIWFDLEDAYTAAITTGTFAASATNGSYVNVVDAETTGDAYAATSAFDSTDPDVDGNGWVIVTQPEANKAGSTTVTLSYNGAVVATKTLTWMGDIASIEIDTDNSNGIWSVNSGEDSAANQLGLYYKVKDAAGNLINVVNTNKPTLTGGTGAFVGASVTTSNATTITTLQTTSLGYGQTTLIIPDSTLRGTGTFKLRIKNAAGANVDSAAVTMTVADEDLDSFSVSFDKASYAPGEIATLTVTGKDSGGRAIWDGYAAAGNSLIAPSGFTAVGAACGTAKVFVSGAFTCKFTAGNTGGSYGWSYDMTTATPQAAVVGTLSIKTSGVTNEEVLAAIVKLIASINKQIALLQKQLKKK